MNCLWFDSFSAASFWKLEQLHLQLHVRPCKSAGRQRHDGHIHPGANGSHGPRQHLDPSLPRPAPSCAGEGAYSQEKSPSERPEPRWSVVHLQHEEPRREFDATSQCGHRIHRSGIRWKG